MAKPMSDKQRRAIKGCEIILGVKYTGSDTAQGAFLFLREHYDEAKTIYTKFLEAYAKGRITVQNVNDPVKDWVVKEMVKHRYTGADYDDPSLDYDDDDERPMPYPNEVPDLDQLKNDVRILSVLLGL